MSSEVGIRRSSAPLLGHKGATVSAIAGIDFDSTGVYVVLVDEESGAYLERLAADLAGGTADAFDRARRVRDLLPFRGWWRDTCIAVGIEEPFSNSYRSAAGLARVQGAVLACLPPDLLACPIAPNRKAPDGWKALTVGTTTASKEEVREWAESHGLPVGLEQDFADAFCIARAMRSIYAAREVDRVAA